MAAPKMRFSRRFATIRRMTIENPVASVLVIRQTQKLGGKAGGR